MAIPAIQELCKNKKYFNDFQNIFLLEYRGWVGIKISIATVSVPETLYLIMDMLETTFACENKVSSKAPAAGPLMKSQMKT